MLSKALLIVLAFFLFLKFVLRATLRQFGQRLDRAVNVALVLIVIAYTAHVVWWLSAGP